MKLQPMIKANLSDNVKQYLYSYIQSMSKENNLKLPPENDLSANLGVSRVTVRRALDELEREGIIIRRQGKGTFINAEAVHMRPNLMPGEEFLKLLSSCGYEAAFEVLDICKKGADPETAKALGLTEDRQIWQVEKIYFADGHPAIISLDRFPAALFKEEIDPDEFAKMSVFELLRKYTGLVIVRDKIRIEAADTPEFYALSKGADRLECKSALVFNGINYDRDNRPIIYDTEIYDTNYVKFNLMRVKNVYE